MPIPRGTHEIAVLTANVNGDVGYPRQRVTIVSFRRLPSRLIVLETFGKREKWVEKPFFVQFNYSGSSVKDVRVSKNRSIRRLFASRSSGSGRIWEIRVITRRVCNESVCKRSIWIEKYIAIRRKKSWKEWKERNGTWKYAKQSFLLEHRSPSQTLAFEFFLLLSRSIFSKINKLHPIPSKDRNYRLEQRSVLKYVSRSGEVDRFAITLLLLPLLCPVSSIVTNIDKTRPFVVAVVRRALRCSGSKYRNGRRNKKIVSLSFFSFERRLNRRRLIGISLRVAFVARVTRGRIPPIPRPVHGDTVYWLRGGLCAADWFAAAAHHPAFRIYPTGGPLLPRTVSSWLVPYPRPVPRTRPDITAG